MIINVNMDAQLHRAICPPCKWESDWMSPAWTNQAIRTHFREQHDKDLDVRVPEGS